MPKFKKKKLPRMYLYKVKRKPKYLGILYNKEFFITNVKYNIISIKVIKKFKKYYPYKIHYDIIKNLHVLANKLKQTKIVEGLNLNSYGGGEYERNQHAYYDTFMGQNCLEYTKITYYTNNSPNINLVYCDQCCELSDDWMYYYEEEFKDNSMYFKFFNRNNYKTISTKLINYKLNYLNTLIYFFKIKQRNKYKKLIVI